MSSHYPTLKFLISGYFHQDWDLEGGTDADIVKFFKESNDDVESKSLITEIDDILDNHTENEVVEILEELNCAFNYKFYNASAKGWLNNIKEYLTNL